MKKTTLGFFLLLLIGASGILAWKYLAPIFFDRELLATSDAGEGVKLRICGDNYLGYWFINSPEMRKQASRKGINLSFEDDGGKYAQRLTRFNEGAYDCIVLPVNTYLEQAAAYRFPGVIVAAISESKGADGIVGFADRLPSGKINDLNDDSLRFVYTPDSPSSFLLDLTISDFDLDLLRRNQSNHVHVDGSTAVLERARKNEGDVFILWEPDLSKALTLPGMKYVWGSDRFSGYIVDVFVFHRDFVKSQPDRVRDFLATYFRVLSTYGNNRDEMLDEMARGSGLKKDAVAAITDKIDWLDLAENTRLQFGIAPDPSSDAKEGMINTIIACTDVLIRSGKLDKDPLSGNPYQITNSTFLEKIAADNILSRGTQGGKVQFTELALADWARLHEVGTFRVEPINFQSGDDLLSAEGKERVDKIASLLTNNYPHYRVIIRGHTGPGGDEAANQTLSEARARVVRQYLLAVHALAPERLLAQGVGSTMPPPQKPGESPRAYRYRLPRVEFIAVEDKRL